MAVREWTKAFDRAGGMANAMLHGPTLASLMAYVDQLEAEAVEAERGRIALVQTATEANGRAAATTGLLEVERNELRKVSALYEEQHRDLVAALAVVEAARYDRDYGTLTGKVAAALATYEEAKA